MVAMFSTVLHHWEVTKMYNNLLYIFKRIRKEFKIFQQKESSNVWDENANYSNILLHIVYIYQIITLFSPSMCNYSMSIKI